MMPAVRRVGSRQWDALSFLAERYPQPARAVDIAWAGYEGRWQTQGMTMVRALVGRGLIEHWPLCPSPVESALCVYRVTHRGLTARRERRRRGRHSFVR